jgi:hypothetical protein
VFRCDRSGAAGDGVALFVNRSIKVFLAYIGLLLVLILNVFWFLFASMMSPF